MQILNPWGKETLSFQLAESLLDQLKDLSRQCQSYYISVEKKRNGSIQDSISHIEVKDEILNKLDQIGDYLKSQSAIYSSVLDNALMKQSFMAALIANILGFEHQLQQVANVDGKSEVRGVMIDRSGNKIETCGISDPFQTSDINQSVGSFYVASKRAFISGVSALSELDIVSKFSEVLI